MSTHARPSAEQIWADCGGRPRTSGGAPAMWFGLNPSEARDTAAVVRPFRESEPLVSNAKRLLLTDYPKMANKGKHPAYSWQRTGSCVNSGGNNCMLIRAGIDACVGTGGALLTHAFTLPAYAYSRYLAFGDTSPGEGSSGDALCRAFEELGQTELVTAGLDGVIPKPTFYTNAWCFTANQELQWSAWRNVPEAVKGECKKQKLVEYVAVKTLAQAESEIRKLRPLSWAGNWGSSDTMRYRGAGANRVLFGEHASAWEHQQACGGVWAHPEFGRLWLILNNWYYVVNGEAIGMHGEPANDEPPGSYWVDDSAMQWQLSYKWGEVRSYASTVPYDQGKISVFGV